MTAPTTISELIQLLITPVSATNAGVRYIAGTAPVVPVDVAGLSDDQLNEMLSKCLAVDSNGKWAVRVTLLAEDAAVDPVDNYHINATSMFSNAIGKDTNGNYTVILATTT